MTIKAEDNLMAEFLEKYNQEVVFPRIKELEDKVANAAKGTASPARVAKLEKEMKKSQTYILAAIAVSIVGIGISLTS